MGVDYLHWFILTPAGDSDHLLFSGFFVTAENPFQSEMAKS